MAAGPEFCWPSARSFVAVYPEDFMAADTRISEEGGSVLALLDS
jgi:hypothetical protein